MLLSDLQSTSSHEKSMLLSNALARQMPVRDWSCRLQVPVEPVILSSLSTWLRLSQGVAFRLWNLGGLHWV